MQRQRLAPDEARIMGNRAAKAARLARFIVQAVRPRPVSVEDVVSLTDEQWIEIAEMAGEDPPSEITRALVIGLVRELRGADW